MSTLASERSWLFNPNLLKLTHQCRRLIRSEFGVKLHLTDENLEHRLADYASKTRSSHLIKTWETLRPQIPNLPTLQQEEEDMAGAQKRFYRGQLIEEKPTAPRPRKQKIIYRGQVVE